MEHTEGKSGILLSDWTLYNSFFVYWPYTMSDQMNLWNFFSRYSIAQIRRVHQMYFMVTTVIKSMLSSKKEEDTTWALHNTDVCTFFLKQFGHQNHLEISKKNIPLGGFIEYVCRNTCISSKSITDCMQIHWDWRNLKEMQTDNFNWENIASLFWCWHEAFDYWFSDWILFCSLFLWHLQSRSKKIFQWTFDLLFILNYTDTSRCADRLMQCRYINRTILFSADIP